MAAIDHFRVIVPVDQQKEKKVTIFEGVVDNHEEVELLLHTGGREEYI